MHVTRHQPVALELAQRLREHFLAHVAEALAEAGKAQLAAALELLDDEQRPLVRDAPEHLVHERFLLRRRFRAGHGFSEESIAQWGAYFPKGM